MVSVFLRLVPSNQTPINQSFMEYQGYRRRLPHIIQSGWASFSRGGCTIPFRLETRFATEREDSPGNGRRFAKVDRYLDAAAVGPTWLRDEAVAECVDSAIREGAVSLNRYILHDYVVMPNHVHALISPKVELKTITQGLKGFTARRANELLHRTGQPFWQSETFDHWCRSEDEFYRIKRYILHNPVRAGLVKNPEDWRWSSARME